MSLKKVVLFGASGHGKVIVEIAENLGYKILGFIDADQSVKELLDYKVLSENLDDFREATIVICIGNNFIRKRIVESHANYSFIKLLSPKANISKRAIIDVGTVVMDGATINTSSHIGKHCIINTNASVDHDCILGDYVHISPNVALAGNVHIGEGTHIGIGACVIQGVKIGNWCTIGAGAVVIRDVPEGASVVGNPAKLLNQ